MNLDLARFIAAFPPRDARIVDAHALSTQVLSRFGMKVPSQLVSFWEQLGTGYFGSPDLYFFGSDELADDSLVQWNSAEFWTSVYPSRGTEGPLFFAETPFGDQLGFRYEGEELVIVLFVPDTFEGFKVAGSFEELFSHVLVEPSALTDHERLARVRSHLGALPGGHHYAPIVTPLVGGTDSVSNFMLISRRAHLLTSLAEFKSIGEAE